MTQAHEAYSKANIPTKSSRILEYDAIALVTSNLTAASNTDLCFPELVAAVEANRRLWTVIASSVADVDNSFPQGLKAQLFYLYEFTTAHSRKVIHEAADISPMIDVNLSVMRGLKSVPTQ